MLKNVENLKYALLKMNDLNVSVDDLTTIIEFNKKKLPELINLVDSFEKELSESALRIFKQELLNFILINKLKNEDVNLSLKESIIFNKKLSIPEGISLHRDYHYKYLKKLNSNIIEMFKLQRKNPEFLKGMFNLNDYINPNVHMRNFVYDLISMSRESRVFQKPFLKDLSEDFCKRITKKLLIGIVNEKRTDNKTMETILDFIEKDITFEEQKEMVLTAFDYTNEEQIMRAINKYSEAFMAIDKKDFINHMKDSYMFNSLKYYPDFVLQYDNIKQGEVLTIENWWTVFNGEQIKKEKELLENVMLKQKIIENPKKRL